MMEHDLMAVKSRYCEKAVEGLRRYDQLAGCMGQELQIEHPTTLALLFDMSSSLPSRRACCNTMMLRLSLIADF